MLTTNFSYSTSEDQHLLEMKSAVGQTYQLLFWLTGSKKHTIKNKQKNITEREREWRAVCVCVCVCVWVATLFAEEPDCCSCRILLSSSRLINRLIVAAAEYCRVHADVRDTMDNPEIQLVHMSSSDALQHASDSRCLKLHYLPGSCSCRILPSSTRLINGLIVAAAECCRVHPD